MVGNRGKSIQVKRQRARFVFILLFLVAFGLFFSSRNNNSMMNGPQAVVEDVAASVLQYLTMPLRGLESVSSTLSDRFKAHKQNEDLRQELARLSDIESRANALTHKLNSLETILSVEAGSGVPQQKIAARAVSESNGPFVRSALINAGSKKGVKFGDAVMTVNGLYGHVVRAGNNSSRVLKLEDLNSRIAVMSERSQARAILTGNNSRKPGLSFIADDADWQVGDVVVTSGDDGVLPAALPVGIVGKTPNDLYQVDLFVHQNFVDWVWVYPFQKTSPPEADAVPDLAEELTAVECGTP